MPAVSTNRQVVPPSSISSSTGSRVVPATESTTARCSPASLFSRDDLPTLGRPMSATRRGPASACRSRGASGSASSAMVEHVAAAAAVHGGDHDRLAEPERPQRQRVGLALGVVHLVGDEHDRLARPAQHPGDRLVLVGGADPGVHHEQHRVGEADRDLRLLGHLGGQALRLGQPAAGVHQGELPAAPVGVVGHPVPGNTRHVLHDRLARAEDPVDQRGLADVGTADHGEHRLSRPCRARRRRPSSASAAVMSLRSSPTSTQPSSPASKSVNSTRLVLRQLLLSPAHTSRLRSRASRAISPMTSSRVRSVASRSSASAAFSDCAASSRSRRA